MTARRSALDVVRDVFLGDERNRRGAQESLDYRLRRSALEARDRALATELAYGSIKMRRLLDWYLRPYVGDRRQLPPAATMEILRLGTYELLFMRSAHHAVVHEWVGLANAFGHRGTAGLVNAILRGFIRDAPRAPMPEDFEDVDDYFGTQYSLPTWIVKAWRAQFGDGPLQAILQGVNEPPQSAVAVNTARTTIEDALQWFEEHGYRARRSVLVDESLLIDRERSQGGEEAVGNGTWQLQSEAAAMPVDVLNPQPGEAVLDVCSGRGNKAVQAGARLRAEGALTCIEKDERKVRILQRRLEAAGINAAVVVGDATQRVVSGAFDRVVLDAPCSSIGVVGRHPEARWRKDSNDAARFAPLQRELLEQTADRVYPGGVLVYSVCSNDPREGREVVDSFLRHRNFERGLIPSRYASFLSAEGDVVVPPGVQRRDGFFIARLERVC